MYIDFGLTGILYKYMNTSVLVPVRSSKPCKSCPSLLHIPFPHTFSPLLTNICSQVYFQLSCRWQCFLWCLLSPIFLHISLNNHILFNFVGSGWLFYFCSYFWSGFAYLLCNVFMSSCGLSVPDWCYLSFTINLFLRFLCFRYQFLVALLW